MTSPKALLATDAGGRSAQALGCASRCSVDVLLVAQHIGQRTLGMPGGGEELARDFRLQAPPSTQDSGISTRCGLIRRWSEGTPNCKVPSRRPERLRTSSASPRTTAPETPMLVSTRLGPVSAMRGLNSPRLGMKSCRIWRELNHNQVEVDQIGAGFQSLGRIRPNFDQARPNLA